jgi:hypothetical protein
MQDAQAYFTPSIMGMGEVGAGVWGRLLMRMEGDEEKALRAG